jgi:arylsulfatase A-like enzyme
MNKYKDFVFAEGKPIRSFLNGIWWKTTAEKVPSAASGVIEETNNEIREFRQKNTTKTLVVANYMEAHAPFDPPTDAIRQFTNKPVSQLPVGESGTKIRKKYNTKPDFGASDMYALYKASIWDLDRKVSPLIKEMISDDTFVIVTADHGNWFRLDDYLDEDRIHVPLLIFGPDTQGRYIDNTVNLRHIAATTTATLSEQGYNVNQLPGENILEATDNLISITDFLFRDVIDELETHPVSVHKQENGEWYHHVTAIKGDAKINYNGGSDKLEEIRGSESNLEELRESLSKHVERPVTFDDNQRMQMDEQTKDRLRKLGYIN